MGFLNSIFTKRKINKSIVDFDKIWNISDINDIWEIEDRNNMIVALFGYLCRKSAYGENVEKLTSEEIVIYLCQTFENELNNGGFSQFFYNSSGNFANETLAALQNIGAFQTAAIMGKVVRIFPYSKIPKDRVERELIFDDLCENHNASEELSTADNEFYQCEDDLMTLNYNYIIANKAHYL